MNFEVKNLNCHYGVIQALRDVSFKIVEDGIYAVIGANGAGKSTLINVIAGLVPASSGEIIYGDTVITDLPVKDVIRRGISICPEGRKIFSTITVQENLMAGAYIIKDRQKIKENMDMVYEMFP